MDLSGRFSGLGSKSVTFWGPTNIHYHFWFGSKGLSFNFQFSLILGLFGPFWAIFGVGVRSKNYFGTYLHSLTTFVLEVCGFYSSFILFWVAGWLGGWVGGWVGYWVGGWVAGLVENIAVSAPN